MTKIFFTGFFDGFNDKYSILFKLLKDRLDWDDYIVVDNEKDADISFFSVRATKKEIETSVSKKKVFYSGETRICSFYKTIKEIDFKWSYLNAPSFFIKCPIQNIKYLQKHFDFLIGFFDETIGNNILYCPYWLESISSGQRSNTKSILEYLNKTRNQNLSKDKEKLSTLVATHSYFNNVRNILHTEFSKYGKVHCPGKFKNNDPAKLGGHTKISYISHSYFNICPENSAYPKYCTEKIFDAILGGCIPVYWGYDYPEPDIINKDAYIFADIKNKKALRQQISNAIEQKESLIQTPILLNTAEERIEEYLNNVELKLVQILNL